MQAKIESAERKLVLYKAAYEADDKPAARNAAYELVKLACELHSAADPGASRVNGSKVES
jgi:hypothetical protein